MLPTVLTLALAYLAWHLLFDADRPTSRVGTPVPAWAPRAAAAGPARPAPRSGRKPGRHLSHPIPASRATRSA
jgi:hypothetical protein